MNTLQQYILLIAIFIYLSMSACTSGNAGSHIAEEERAYPVFPLSETDTVLELRYVADIQAYKNVELHARIPGLLKKTYVDEGRQVHKGQLLFKIHDEELRIACDKAGAALNSAIADAKVAEVEVERARMLVDKKIVSKTELDLAEARWHAFQAKVEEAKANKEHAEKRLSYTNIRSPFDGVIDRLPLKEGSLLTDGSLLTTISDIHSMYAYFRISEYEYLQLMQNGAENNTDAVKLILANGMEYAYTGQIEAAESEIDENTGSIAFRANFPNPNKLLKHGASGTLVIRKPVSNTLLIPQKSVFEIQDKNYVFVLGGDNVAHMRSVTLSDRLDDYYIVRQGLSSGEQIVYEGIQTLKDGDKIKPVMPVQ